ncbi:MAG: thioredoxin domain-containing protein [Phycisphaerales bacterium]|nr:thioredoxin domain-containing protein [Phycisphaerales bacterium]
MTSTSATASGNLLRTATSPYLRQHADNPVAWHEWGPAALAAARKSDKPIFLSIGYAACHWCHVMAHESFEDPAIAAILNDHFINIKVDREERPDLDEIYMQATLALNQGQGGWPMSVWLTPDLKPFFAGTYFPPRARYGRPGFVELCEAVAKAWREHRTDIVTQAERLTEVVREGLQPGGVPGAALTLATVDEAAETLASGFDTVSGGMLSGTTNKFPPSMALEVLLRAAHRRPAEDKARARYLHMLTLTLDHMAAGGIYDQLGGGIHRYSTDVEWHVPHFEKMLYDQALVTRIYLDAFQYTARPLYARIAREICDYVLDDLTAPEGGFYSTRDADSEGEEGRYYVWTRAEVLAALGEEDGVLFCAHYDVRDSGNWRDPHHPQVPKNVLRALRDVDCCSKMLSVDKAELCERLGRARRQLLTLRAGRVAPARDEKILCEWNGQMIATLARAGTVLDEPRYVAAATRAADFILQHQWCAGRLHRSYHDGRTLPVAFLSDYACFIDGLLELYEATFEPRWLDMAATLHTATQQHYGDAREGGFFFTADDHEALIARSKDLRDAAVPSGNSVHLLNLLRLGALLGDHAAQKCAAQMLVTFARAVRQSPWSSERFLCGVEFATAGPVEIAVVGPRADERTQALLRTVYACYLPNRVLAWHDPAQPNTRLPMLANRPPLDGQPTAYVCRRGTCAPPVTTPAALAALLT